jgi:hypothetical protein
MPLLARFKKRHDFSATTGIKSAAAKVPWLRLARPVLLTTAACSDIGVYRRQRQAQYNLRYKTRNADDAPLDCITDCILLDRFKALSRRSRSLLANDGEIESDVTRIGASRRGGVVFRSVAVFTRRTRWQERALPLRTQETTV